MFLAYTSSQDGASSEASFKKGGFGFDFANQTGHAKSLTILSPNTDSLDGDLSTSSGGFLHMVAPQSCISSSQMHLMNLHGSDLTRHLNTNAHTAEAGGATTTTTTLGEGSQLFRFATTPVPKGGNDEYAEADNAVLDYSGLESLLMAATGDSSNTPTPRRTNAAPAAVVAQQGSTAAVSLRNSMSLQSTPFAVSFANCLPKRRSTDSVSPVPSRGSDSIPQGCGSLNAYSGDNTLCSSFGPELISISLQQPQLQHSRECSINAIDTALPPALTVVPVPGAADTRDSQPNSVAKNIGSSVSHSANATPENLPSASQPHPTDPEVRSNLFICGLPVTIADKDLLDIFGKYGPIESAKVMLDIHTGRSCGIAFVKFKEVEHAENAVDSLNGTSVDGHPIAVRIANSRAAYLPGNPTNKTFVRNVPLAVSRSTLMEYFSQFGEVTDLSIKSDTLQGRHRGGSGGRSASAVEGMPEEKLNIVFITYSTKEAAARAADATHVKTPFKECNGVPLLAKVAEDTTRRKERLSRRARAASCTENKSVSSNTQTASPPNCTGVAAVQPGMMMVPVGPFVAGGFPGSGYAAMPGVAGADLTTLTVMQANRSSSNNSNAPLPQQPAQQQMNVFRDVNGGLVYSAAAAAPPQTGMAYSIQGGFPPVSQPPPPHQSVYFTTQSPPQVQLQPQPTVFIQTTNGIMAPQAPQAQFIQQTVQPPPAPALQLQGAQGQIMYVQTPNGSVMPALYNGAASAGPMQAQGVSYYQMLSS
ncbi:hypothetical protein ABL78_1696 [Leptomonas seymouri]|uniref:RRM domain-containing protein n=1 Tax=Leptomonas seymouri TaxID=5684 RepID=A0A0N1I1V6_LEPSE|nr:hypothetical protein ABL78_1696 [Leptomonas seymouri]|eukprot:KPI89203.1 hypothetical protein ABL78_1696 [Leptomonas seymouri]